MKRPGLIRRLLPATLFLGLAGALRAQDLDVLKALPPKPSVHAPAAAPAAAGEKEPGANRDGAFRGKMARAGNAAETLRAEILRRFDRNGNGRIDDDELTAFGAAVRTRPGAAPLLRQRLDKNGDGQIDEAEWNAARPQLQQWLNAPASMK